ncbi:MAG: glycosyltransferase family 4 protein, partial [Anaerolineae bacterium]
MRELGHEVDAVWAHDLPHRIRHWGLHHLLEQPGGYRQQIVLRMRQLQYDVVHINQPYAWLAARTLRRNWPGTVVVNRSHGWEPAAQQALRPWRRKYGAREWKFPRGLLGRPMRVVLTHLYPRLALRWSHGVIVSTTYDRGYILKTYGHTGCEVGVIPQAPSPVFCETPAPAMTRD